MRKLLHLIAATRPNFMKIAPLFHALRKESWAEVCVVHTGQHYDLNMSDVFFRDMGLPEPDLHLGIGSGTHAEQTARVMVAYEAVICETRPDLVIVVGDVNSTMAATLAAAKLGVKVAHLEAGLRSFDRTMPEEVNRLVTDVLADVLWTPSPDADENLLREGIPREKIVRVGNIMIDSLEMLRPSIERLGGCTAHSAKGGDYAVVTLHRPSNVDDYFKLEQLCMALRKISKRLPIFFPIHPRTRRSLDSSGLMPLLAAEAGIRLLEPLSYIEFMNLLFGSRLVITDSGGIQEETTYLGIPCLTLRANTERPVTVLQGTNRLCEIEGLETIVEDILSNNGLGRQWSIPELWDGCTSKRVVASIKALLDAGNGKICHVDASQ